MPARSARILLLNSTPYTLTLASSGLDHGEWTPGGWTPPPSIPPGAQKGWQSESDGVATGTEGSISFTISGQSQPLTIHWDNPYVGLNSYHQTIGSGLGLSFSGGKGNNSEAYYTLQTDAAVFVPGFKPSVNGFPFVNSWPAETIVYLKLPPFNWWGNGIALGSASNGLCGGMSFAVCDYFYAKTLPPQIQPPGVTDPVFDYIARRLVDSFNSPINGSCSPGICGGFPLLANVIDFETQMDPIYPDSDNYITDGTVGDGRAWIMAHEAFPQIKAAVDAGKLFPLGLVEIKSLLPTDLGTNHQVVAWGYQLEQQECTIYLYDPNQRQNDNVTLKLNISDTGERIVVTRNPYEALPVYSFFGLRYSSIGPYESSGGAWFEVLGETKVHPGAQITAIWRSAGTHLDLFVTGTDGSVVSTWWEATPGWQPWFLVQPAIKMQIGAAVTALWSGNDTHIDLFATGTDGAVWSTFWTAPLGWQPWFLIHPEIKMQPGVTVTAAWSGNETHLDLFATGTDGAVWSTFWTAPLGWQPWFLIHPETKMQPGATVTAVWSGNQTHLDLFVTGTDGAVWSTFWNAQTSWQPWFLIHAETKMMPAAPVTAVWRSSQTHLDLFATDASGTVWTTWWEATPGWQAWFSISAGTTMAPGALVTALWSFGDTHLNIFAGGNDGTVQSSLWEADIGWQSWSPVYPAIKMQPGAPVTALFRTNVTHLDFFVTGTDGAVWSTWW